MKCLAHHPPFLKHKTMHVDFPAVEFDLILADPPWKYNFAKTKNRAVENHYPTMSLGEICSLSPPSAPNCVLLLWATAPKLREALAVITCWGFTYKTNAIWNKQKIGMGYWFRGMHELLLVATKGKVSPPQPANRKPSLFSYPRGWHSAKPVEVYDMVEEMFPTSNKLEMFARCARTGWTSWGNELCEKT